MTTKAAAFLKNMNLPEAQDEAAEPASAKRTSRAVSALEAVQAEEPGQAAEAIKSAARARKSLKHIGGYFDTETVEKVALLRARLDLDNSELIKRAIDELFAKQKAARAFGN